MVIEFYFTRSNQQFRPSTLCSAQTTKNALSHTDYFQLTTLQQMLRK